MKMRTLTVAALVALIASSLHAQQNDSVAKVGDMIAIKMTGDLANEYVKRTKGDSGGAIPTGTGIQVELAATINHVFEDGALGITCSLIMRDEKPIRLVTLTGKIDPQKLTTDITPKGTKVFGSPGGEPQVTKKDYTNRRFELLDFKGFKLRIWNLVDEFGE